MYYWICLKYSPLKVRLENGFNRVWGQFPNKDPQSILGIRKSGLGELY